MKPGRGGTGSLAKTDVKDETRPRGVSFYSVQLRKAEYGGVHVRQPLLL